MLSNSQKNVLMSGVLVIAAGSVGAFFYLTAPESSESPAGSPTVNTPQSIKPVTGQPGGLTPQPPGEVPPGKIWSAEHGHWHDIQTGATQPTATATGQPGQLTPQPPGEVPPGKIWSAEHGHWHDIQTGAAQPTATATSQPGKLTPQPPGEVPPGKAWSAEHGHWHDAPKVRVINPNEAGSSDDQ